MLKQDIKRVKVNLKNALKEVNDGCTDKDLLYDFIFESLITIKSIKDSIYSNDNTCVHPHSYVSMDMNHGYLYCSRCKAKLN